MLLGAAAIFTLVAALLVYAFWRADRPQDISERKWIIGGGLVFPLVTLLALVTLALVSGERLIARDDPGVLAVDAVANQYRWEFHYPGGSAEPSPVLVVPADQPVNVRVTSSDVIHSFWLPRLAGKIDAIPGHVNVIRIVAERPGVYRGQCAEFCGHGHADMHFYLEALQETEFAAFLASGRLKRLEGSARRSDP